MGKSKFTKAGLNKPFWVTLAVMACLGLTAVKGLYSQRNRVLASQGTKKLVFAIDGLSYEAFTAARKKGLFPDFQQSSRHIAPYPSMTEPSWTEVTGAKKVFGQKGNVGTIEAKSVNSDSLEIQDDPRTVFTRYASPYSFMRAFDYYFNPVLETLMYFPGKEVVETELGEIEREATEKFTQKDSKDHVIVYVSAVDAIAHTQINQLSPLLEKLSAMIERVRQSYRDRGIAVETWIMSDHGNVGAFSEETGKESYLREVDLANAAQSAGLQIVESGKLTTPNQIAIPILALGSMGNVYFKDLSRRRAFAQAALTNPAVELVTWVESNKGASSIAILGTEHQEARLIWSKEGYAYIPISGNPLDIPTPFHSTSQSQPRWITDEKMFEATQDSHYPDSAYRLVMAAKKQVTNEPDLIINLKDGYCFRGSFSEFVHMVRTHGALSARATFGLLASDSAREIPSAIRSIDILPTIGVSERETFRESADLFEENSGVHALRNQQQIHAGLSTRIFELTQDLLFRRFAKILNSTMDFLTPSEARSLQKEAMELFKATQNQKSNDSLAATLKKLDPTQAMSHIDEIAQLRGILATEKDPKAIAASAQKRLLAIPGFEALGPVLNAQASRNSSIDPRQEEFLRHTAMKLYSSRDLLNEILNLPETETVEDTRNHGFAAQWFESGRNTVLEDPDLLARDPGLSRTLFDSIFSERKLVHQLAPATFPRLFDPDLAKMKNLAVVFVPGIYNELFDREIFAKGLRSIRENLGLRVIYADVDGRCDATTNGQKIIDQLKEDTAQRLSRGYPEPRYMILGYSKGAVDATEALLLDESFTRSKILGLLSIAAPLRGTKIVESADLPSEITDGLTVKPLAAGCESRGASHSLLRATRENFWSKNLAKLATLTRFYSVSFESSMQDAHPWMKICKMIGKFNAPNDGVVTVEASHFPDASRAVNLGTIAGDHLAGILASAFPQEAFMDSLILTLHQIGAFDPKTNEKWYRAASRYSPALVADFHRRAMEQKIVSTLEPISGFLGPVQIEDSEQWFLPIFAEQYALKTPIHCNPNALSGITRAIGNKLSDGPYALKPLTLSCNADGSLKVSLETARPAFYKIWEKPSIFDQSVKTLGELIELLLSRGLRSNDNPLEAGSQAMVQVPKSNRPAIELPPNGMKWTEDLVIDLKASGKTISQVPVQPILPGAMPKGFSVIYDHASLKDFRREYQFSYESRTPGGMDDNPQGFFPWIDVHDGQNEVALRMRSRDNSIRMSSSAMRFRVTDFPKFKTRLKVLHGPNRPDSAKGGAGRDDSAFELWFTLRNLRGSTDRSLVAEGSDVRLFGYFWSDPDEKGHTLQTGDLIENYFSKKNFVVATLPESWEVALGGGPSSENKWLDIQRNLADDIKRAYPSEDPANWEVISITIWVATNDTKSDSEAYFKSFSLEP